MSRREDTISVLLPVHAGVAPAHFEAAVASLLEQTRAPDQVVVVQDGPLQDAHLLSIALLKDRFAELIVISLPENRGAGVANQAGLAAATGTWIAKMDADDICLPTRFDRQYETVRVGGLDLCGSAMAEFDSDPKSILGVRSNPLTHEAIARRMRINNPINHPTAFYRRECAVSVGGYPTMRYMQDYDLFARMLVAGARMANLPDVLVLFRADSTMMTRRRGAAAGTLERELQRNLHRYGVTTRWMLLRNRVLRSAFRRLPPSVVARVYVGLFRRGQPLELEGPSR